MPVSPSASSRWNFRSPILIAAVIGASTIAATVCMYGIYSWWKTLAGPFFEFEILLPPGILLPPDNKIEVTFWSDGIGMVCRGIEVRRSVDPPEIAGRCRVMGYGKEFVMSGVRPWGRTV